MIPLTGSQTLNEHQLKIVTHDLGPALVIAGAGSGKTRCLIHRVEHLILQNNIQPDQILCVTFTNKAASEMRERAFRTLGEQAKKVWISTFHRFCLDVLRRYGEHINLKPTFTVMDEDKQISLIKQILNGMEGAEGVKAKQVAKVIDLAKNAYLGPFDLQTDIGKHLIPEHLPESVVVEAFKEYRFRTRELGTIDFNDIINHTIRLFQEVPQVLDKIQDRALYTMVDEYQDTNTAQHLLTSLLCSRDRNLMCIGDPDQSIYKWRGADVDNILKFKQPYPEAVTYMLEINYRSTQAILNAANTLIQNNQNRLEKNLKATKQTPAEFQTIDWHDVYDHNREAELVASLIIQKHKAGISLADITILYRNNLQSRALETALRRARIPARIHGGVGFYQRKEIKDLLAYLQLTIDPHDDLSLERIINTPARGIGDASVQKMLDWAKEHSTSHGERLSLFDAMGYAPAILSRGSDKVLAFHRQLLELVDVAQRLKLSDLIQKVRILTGYDDHLVEMGEDGKDRLDNLNEFTAHAKEWEKNNPGNVHDFLNEITLLTGTEDSSGDASVTLMTMHTAKGLEFPHVIITALNDKVLPSERTLKESGFDNGKGLEEERRLFYVALTRAMESLTLISARNRFHNGEMTQMDESLFIKEIADHVEHVTHNF